MLADPNQGGTTVTVLNTVDGSVAMGPLTVGTAPSQCVYDSVNNAVWVTCFSVGGTIVKLSAVAGTILGTFTIAAGRPLTCTYDGANIWVGNYTTSLVSQLRAATGSIVGTFTITSTSSILYDGVFVHAYYNDTVNFHGFKF